MAILAGRLCTLYVGGTPTTMTTEACTQIGATDSYQIAEAAKRAIDPATAVEVFEDGSPSTPPAIDYVNGIISYDDGGHGTITITAKYIPLHAFAEAKSADIVVPQAVMADVTLMGDTGSRVLEVAKKCEITLAHFATPATDFDVSESGLLFSALLAGELIFVRAAISTTQTINGWFAPSATWQHDINEALQGTLTLVGQIQTCVGRPVTDQALFSLT